MSKRGMIFFGGSATASLNMMRQRQIQKQRQIQWMQYYKEKVYQQKAQDKLFLKLVDEELTESFSREKVEIITDKDYGVIKEIKNDASKFKSGNSLIIAMHAGSTNNDFVYGRLVEKYNNKYKVVLNNLMNLKLNDIDNIIIVISADNNEMLSKFIEVLSKCFNKNLIFIRDITNKYYDFGKYKMAYKYLTQQGMVPQYIHLMNDSFIICEKVGHICDNITDKLKSNDFIGILESQDVLPHYPSWWIVIKKSLYEKYFGDIALVNHRDIGMHPKEKKWRTILRNEVKLSNNILNDSNFNCDYIFSGRCPPTAHPQNIFHQPLVFINAWINGFKIMKIGQSAFNRKDAGIAVAYKKYITRVDNIEI